MDVRIDPDVDDCCHQSGAPDLGYGPTVRRIVAPPHLHPPSGRGRSRRGDVGPTRATAARRRALPHTPASRAAARRLSRRGHLPARRRATPAVLGAVTHDLVVRANLLARLGAALAGLCAG